MEKAPTGETLVLPIYKVKRKKEPVKVHRDGREVCDIFTKAGFIEYRRRLLDMRLRQDGLCSLCGEWMTETDCFFEHSDGRGHGGGNRDDRIEKDGKPYNSAAHGHCNIKKASVRLKNYGMATMIRGIK
jgi:hypothetical protein